MDERDEHQKIWLQPWCVDCESNDHSDTGRTWCQDQVYEACELCGREPVRYVLAATPAPEVHPPTGVVTKVFDRDGEVLLTLPFRVSDHGILWLTSEEGGKVLSHLAAIPAQPTRLEVATARIEKLEAALREIARQKKTDELETEYEVQNASFEDSHDLMIDRARAALSDAPTPAPKFSDFVEGCDYLPAPPAAQQGGDKP